MSYLFLLSPTPISVHLPFNCHNLKSGLTDTFIWVCSIPRLKRPGEVSYFVLTSLITVLSAYVVVKNNCNFWLDIKVYDTCVGHMIKLQLSATEKTLSQTLIQASTRASLTQLVGIDFYFND